MKTFSVLHLGAGDAVGRDISPEARLFDDFLVVGLTREPTVPHKVRPKTLYHFKEGRGGGEIDAAAISEFCFPDLEDVMGPSESFTFTLTQGEGTRVFGFCRRLIQQGSGQLPICLCVLTQRPWFSLFMHMLDTVQLNYDLGRFVPMYVAAAYDAMPG